MKREDDFETRSVHLKGLSEDGLTERFWMLANQLVDPMLDLGRRYTTPAIERSVLLRMGFSSIEAGPIVEGAIRKGLMGKGCGHVVWRLSVQKGISVRQAGLELAEGRCWDEAASLFGKGGR